MGKFGKPHRHDLRELKEIVMQQEERVKRSICSVSFLVDAVKTVALVVVYCVFSICLTFYNRYLFKGSGVALSITMCHLIFKFIASGFVRFLLECKTKEERTMLDWSSYIKRVAAPGIVSSLDIGFSNWSFEFITVSLYTMCKSTAVIFVLIFSVLFRLEKCRLSWIVIVFFIFAGLLLSTYKSTQFNWQGLLLVMVASVFSGLRCTLAQIVLQKKEIGLHNPVDMMYHIQPWMIMALFPLSVSKEIQSISTTEHYFRFTEWSMLMETVGSVMIGAFLGFMLELSEFLLLSQTSSLTFSISGIFKELIALGLAVIINKDKMSPLNALGLVICVTGIAIHVICKAVFAKEEKSSAQKNGNVESLEMLTRDGSANDGSESEDEVDLFSVDRDR